MKPTYRDFLHLRTTLKELPKNFYNKLDISEKTIFDELITTIDSTFTPKRSPKKSDIRQAEPNPTDTFQPRQVILCLNLTKIIESRQKKDKRFTFGLIRCLYRDFVRVLRSPPKRPSQLFEVQETKSENATLDAEQNIIKVRTQYEIKRKALLKNLIKLMIERKNLLIRKFLFVFWQKQQKFQVLRKKLLLQSLWKVALNRKKVGFSLIFPVFRLPSKLKFKFLLNTIKSLTYKKLVYSFASIQNQKLPTGRQVQRRSLKKAELGVSVGEILPVLNLKQVTLIENACERTTSAKGVKPEGQENIQNEIEDFRYGERKNTKMVKKKRQRLRRVSECEKFVKLEKNLRWVQAFAMLKWKQIYYSRKTKAQKKSNLGAVVLQLLEKTSEKIRKNRKSLFFDTIKIKYSINKQSFPFKLTLAMNSLEHLLSNKIKILQHSSFNSIRHFILRSSSPDLAVPQTMSQTKSQTSASNFFRAFKSCIKKINLRALRFLFTCFQRLSSSAGKAETAEERQEKQTYFFYKKLKTVLKRVQLKRKIMGFVSLSNHFDLKADKSSSGKLTSMFQVLYQLYFSRLFTCLQDIREKSVISMIRSQAFYFIIHSVFEKKTQSYTRTSLCKIKASAQGGKNFSAGLIEKKIFTAMVRDGFRRIKEFSVNVDNFRYLRSAFTKSLTEKIYFKRLSSCFV